MCVSWWRCIKFSIIAIKSEKKTHRSAIDFVFVKCVQFAFVAYKWPVPNERRWIIYICVLVNSNHNPENARAYFIKCIILNVVVVVRTERLLLSFVNSLSPSLYTFYCCSYCHRCCRRRRCYQYCCDRCVVLGSNI